MSRIAVLFVSACLALAAVDCAGRPAADLVLLNGKIVTLDDAAPEVQALAARDGRIVATGSSDEIEGFVGSFTRVIDLEGQLAVPGFIEGHGHFVGIGRSLLEIDLRGEPNWEAVVERIARAAEERPPGEWILGWGWHQDKWDRPPKPNVEGYPLHHALSEVTPRNPVLLKHHAGGHAVIANAMALELAGIDENTPDPAGGAILRDAQGRPTGVLRELACDLVLSHQSQAEAAMTAEQLRQRREREIQLASEECLSKGITSFQDAGSTFEQIDLLRETAEAGEIGVRLWVMFADTLDSAELARRVGSYRTVGAADDHFTLRAIKRSIDGALGSHGAWMLEPYLDQPQTTGLNTTPVEDIERTAAIAVEHDLQLCVHAIGDRGNRETLDLFERAFGDAEALRAARWRVEHAQHLHPQDIPRFARLGVLASMQGVHCTSDGPWVPQRIGPERAESGAYVWRSLIDSGARISNGTDAPIEDVSPLANFHATVTRRMGDGERFYGDQRMTRMEALEAATIHAAYAAFEEDLKGSLAPGKLADVTVLSQDILTVPEERLLETEVRYTIVGGQVLYEGNGG